MSQLPIDEALNRFKDNEERFDKFVNGEGYTSTNNENVESVSEFLQRVESEIEQTTGTVAENLNASIAAKNAAEAARDAAIIGSGVYPDEPTGRAAVANGQYFKVQGSGIAAAFEYRRIDSANSTLVAIYPSQAFVDSLRQKTQGASEHYTATQLYRDAVAQSFALFDQNYKLIWLVTDKAGIEVGGEFSGQFLKLKGSAAGYRDAFENNAIIHGSEDANGKTRALLTEEDGALDFIPSESLLEKLSSLAGYRDGFSLTPLFVGPKQEDGSRKALLWAENEDGALDFIPSESLIARLGNWNNTEWRGQVESIGPVRRANSLVITSVQDGDGKIYDACQLYNGSLNSFVGKSSKKLQLVSFQGQSNSGAPRGYISGSYDYSPYPGHVLQFSGNGKSATGFYSQSVNDLVDFESAHDSEATNNFASTLTGHAIEALGYRSPFSASPGFLTQTTWSGGMPISHFQQTASSSYWWQNAIQARQQAKIVAAKYGREIEEKWIIWIQGEGGEHGRTAYANALNTFINSFRPAAKTAIGQNELAKFAIVQTNVGDWPDAEPATSNMESTNLAQWDVARTRFSDGVRLVGPMYQCPIVLIPEDNIHTSLIGRLMLSEMIADAYLQENKYGNAWKPLQPISVTRSGANVDITFEGPQGVLSFDADFVASVQNKGFAYVDSNGVQTISSVSITSGNTVRIILASVPTGTGAKVQYALGNARDSVYDGWSSGRGLLMIQTDRLSHFRKLGYQVPEKIRHYCVKFELEI